MLDETEQNGGEALEAEIADFARRMGDAAPPLGDEAMARIERRLQRALDARRGGRRWARIAWGASAAAAALIAGIGVWTHVHGQKHGPEAVAIQARVHDEYRIPAAALPAAEAPATPLLKLEEYRALLARR